MSSGRYSRQVLFKPLGPEGQARLAASRVLVAGCGALGTHAAELLARAGVGELRLVDRDIVEWSNLHRQAGFEEAHAREGAPKADALASWLRRVSSEVRVDARVAELNAATALDLAAGCDLILDGTDNLPARFLLNDLSYRLGVPWIYAGSIGAEAHVQLFSGTEGPCLRCQVPELPPPGTLATCDTAGVIGPAAALAASWQAALALRWLAEGDALALAGRKAVLLPWALQARVVRVLADPDCPVCARRELGALEGAGAERSTVLCGRRAVQVLPASGGRGTIDLGAAAARLAHLGTVERRERFLRLSAPDFTLTLFADGRALFDGLTDPVRARSLYTRLVGQ
ncbi:MAG: ThiF family adenylyltransferase [Planctomycetes bacterium]|nr:ThiF family adenylyltransferase [Planctomycetota bacterium]